MDVSLNYSIISYKSYTMSLISVMILHQLRNSCNCACNRLISKSQKFFFQKMTCFALPLQSQWIIISPLKCFDRNSCCVIISRHLLGKTWSFSRIKMPRLNCRFWDRLNCIFTRKEIDFWFLLNQPKSDCIYHFSIDFKPNAIPFIFKSIGKW